MTLAAKRLDSLSRNRALAELARRHPEEFKEIQTQLLHELQVEAAVLGGEPPRDRNAPVHVEGEDGCCEHCGQKYPCEQARKRERDKARRRAQPVPRTFEELSTPV